MKNLKFVDIIFISAFVIVSTLYESHLGGVGTFLMYMWYGFTIVLYIPIKGFSNDLQLSSENGNPQTLTWKQKVVVIIAGIISPPITAAVSVGYWYIYKKSLGKARLANLIVMGLFVATYIIGYGSGVLFK